MTDIQTLARRIAVASVLKKKCAEAEEEAKAALAQQMTRGSIAATDDCNREIGLVSVPRPSKDGERYEIDESVALAWIADEMPEAIEPRIADWARKDIIERAKKAHAAGVDLPAGVERIVTPARAVTPRFTSTLEDSEMGIHSGAELVEDMLRRGVLDLQAVLEVEA